MSPSPFTLVKWYLDCVGEDGAAFVAYSAELRWNLFTLHYASSLLCDPAGGIEAATSLKNQPPPRLEGSALRWSCPALRIDASWSPLAPSIERQLVTSPHGNLTWSCLQPHAQAEVRDGRGTTLRGLGYAERLEMTLDPGLLPMNALKWGRYLSATDALIWIEWSGESERSVVLLNGTEQSECTISQDAVRLAGSGRQLLLENHAVLRNGALASTALAMIPGIESVAPRKILRAQETKWRSHGRLLDSTQTEASHGWAIHEVVTFGDSRR